tara:strand:- start:120504 stop:121463 length:960 start_codon:yes stop_codon:yes gene_type:complete
MYLDLDEEVFENAPKNMRSSHASASQEGMQPQTVKPRVNGVDLLMAEMLVFDPETSAPIEADPQIIQQEILERMMIEHGAPATADGRVDWDASPEEWENFTEEGRQILAYAIAGHDVTQFSGSSPDASGHFNFAPSSEGSNLTGTFDEAFQHVLAAEGGWNSGRYDAGGETIFGIASRYHPETFNAVMGRLNAGDRAGALEITKQFYKEEFWDAANIESLDSAEARMIAFDTAVNGGIGRAQEHIARAMANDGVVTGAELLGFKADHYRELNATGREVYTRNYAGWMNRVDNLADLIGARPGGTVMTAEADRARAFELS